MLYSLLYPIAGGVLIGLAAGGFMLASGEIAGISGIARHALVGPGRGWRLAFVAGLVAAGEMLAWYAPDAASASFAALSLSRALLAGLLVGAGAGLANGCTSGHGICGLARMSRRSLVAVPVFMATAALTVWLIRHGGMR